MKIVLVLNINICGKIETREESRLSTTESLCSGYDATSGNALKRSLQLVIFIVYHRGKPAQILIYKTKAILR